jgi:DNA helicase-2/ATP-dependent DNA helicase PcrA
MTLAAPLASNPDHLARLNPEQRAAVLHGAGPLLVIAGAGTGKTNTLVHRLAQLLLGGADPRRILLMSFSRRAAAEMTRRAERIAGEVMGPRGAVLAQGLAWAGTFHAMGARLLREHAGVLGLDQDFSIHDREDSADLMNLVRHRLGLSSTERRFPGKGTCLAIYSRVVNAQGELGEVLRRHFPWCADWEAELRRLFAGYVAAKQAQAVLDYDDLLLYWAGAMRDPGLAGEIGARFDHVLVDEYQDTNRLQAAILLGLKPDGRGVTVVGDDAQSIYAFRAAEVRNILDFPGHFDPPARVVALEQNYRSTPEILAAANAVIAEASEGFAKRLRSERPAGERPALVAVRDEAGQVDWLCRAILEAREAGTALREQAVLFRTAHHSGALEVELVRRNIPFVKYGGLKFLDAAHVKDVLACLRLAQNPADRVAGFRVLQLVPGVGPATAEAALDALAAREALAGVAVPKKAAGPWAEFAALYGLLRSGEASRPRMDLAALMRGMWE